MANLYYHATTKYTDKQTTALSDFAVCPGKPLLFLDCQSDETVPVPYWSRNVKINEFNSELYNCIVPFNGKNIQLWILNNHHFFHRDKDAARRLRIYILRLHAEHESLRLVLSGIMSGSIVAQPRTLISDQLQYYINEATRRIGVLDLQSSKQCEDKICDIARVSMDIINPGKKDALVSVLKKIDFRPNILRKVEDYIDKWKNITINIEEVTMGDRYTGNQVGAQGPNAHAHEMTFNQVWHDQSKNIELPVLAEELEQLRSALRDEPTSAENDIVIGAVANAGISAKDGDGPKALGYLKMAGKTALSCAEKIGTIVAVAAIKAAIGI